MISLNLYGQIFGDEIVFSCVEVELNMAIIGQEKRICSVKSLGEIEQSRIKIKEHITKGILNKYK